MEFRVLKILHAQIYTSVKFLLLPFTLVEDPVIIDCDCASYIVQAAV